MQNIAGRGVSKKILIHVFEIVVDSVIPQRKPFGGERARSHARVRLASRST
jgi:hypothetical protein